jgi:cytosine/adenosine deaminase-related metal-dependent hydrolase/SAM-dependent methyltransferase
MLSLEERFLGRLLPPVQGRDVLDLGCGTGRWLEKLAAQSPQSLTGLDASPEMLAHAEGKLAARATLLLADCHAPPVAPRSADLILCSFVLSYMQELVPMIEQIRRIARSDSNVFVTDLHPETEAKFGWRRGFRDGDAQVHIQTRRRSLDRIVRAFERQGFAVALLLEPRFDDREFDILRRAGKENITDALRSHPAIYILQFRPAPIGRATASAGLQGVQHIQGARIAFGGTEAEQAEIEIAHGRVAGIQSTQRSHNDAETQPGTIDLTGWIALPGLVNAHDHLEFALFPRLGRRGYQNFLEWAEEIHRPDISPVLEHRSIPKSARLWWGAIRNLLCGVTTVCHHNPYLSDVFDRSFPIRVARDFGWAHSLKMEANAAERHASTPKGQPFIIHLAEGVDGSLAGELSELERIGALTSRTVIVHGLALDACGRTLLKQSGAALVWCPSSNQFLFGRTHSREAVEELPFVALGSDSSLTAEGDLLDEVRFAGERVGIPAEKLYEQVTSAAARILRLGSGEGTIRIGAVADFVAIRDNNLSPAETLAQSTYRDVELVILGGRVQLASPRLKERLVPELTGGMEPLEIDGEVRWMRAPVAELVSDTRSALGSEITMNGRRLNRVGS